MVLPSAVNSSSAGVAVDDAAVVLGAAFKVAFRNDGTCFVVLAAVDVVVVVVDDDVDDDVVVVDVVVVVVAGVVLVLLVGTRSGCLVGFLVVVDVDVVEVDVEVGRERGDVDGISLIGR